MSRKVKIDFSADTPVIESFGGEFGENAFVEVEVIPETEMTEMPDLSLYYVVFAVEGGVLPTSMFNAGEEIKFTLPSAITSQKKAAGQLWAQDAMGTILAKSPIFTLYLGDSVEGNIVDDPQTGDTIYAQLAAAIQACYEVGACVKVLKENDQGYANMSISELIQCHEEGTQIVYKDNVLQYSSNGEASIYYYRFDVSTLRQYQVVVAGARFPTIREYPLIKVASDNQGVRNTIKTINEWLVGLVKQKATITLDKLGWLTNQQTVNVTNMTETAIVQVAPTPDSYLDYGNAQIRCTEQSNGSLTFVCESEPTQDITVNVLWGEF